MLRTLVEVVAPEELRRSPEARLEFQGESRTRTSACKDPFSICPLRFGNPHGNTRQSLPPCQAYPLIRGWFGFGLEPLVLVEGSHQSDPSHFSHFVFSECCQGTFPMSTAEWGLEYALLARMSKRMPDKLVLPIIYRIACRSLSLDAGAWDLDVGVLPFGRHHKAQRSNLKMVAK